MLNVHISEMFNISALPLSEFHLVKPRSPSAHPLQCNSLTTAAQSLEILCFSLVKHLSEMLWV